MGQNSFRYLSDVLGSIEDVTPPLVEIMSPHTNQVLSPGFLISALASDEDGLGSVKVRVDDVEVATLLDPPFEATAPLDLAPGAHEVEVRAIDHFGEVGRDIVYAVVGPLCPGARQCDATEVCVDGRCVAGPGVAGGLGGPCTGDEECASGLCGSAGDERRCVEMCEAFCPDGFRCDPAPALGSGACWPAAPEPSGCAIAASGQEPPWAWLVLGLLAWARSRGRAPGSRR